MNLEVNGQVVVAVVAQNYTVQTRQGAFDAGDTIPDRFVSNNSDAVVFNSGNVNQAVDLLHAIILHKVVLNLLLVLQGCVTTSQVGAVHASTNWRVWMTANDFNADGSGRNPFTAAVFNFVTVLILTIWTFTILVMGSH